MNTEPARPTPRGAAAAREAVEHAVRRFQQGEREAGFGALHQRFYRPLMRFFARRGCGPEECLDLTQETFLRIYTGLEGFRGESRFETWLYRLATTTFLKLRRAEAAGKRSAHEVAADDLPEGVEPFRAPAGQLDAAIERERRRRLRAAVGELPERMRECVMLCVYQEMSLREIGKVLKIESDTVKAHLFQARRKLRQRLPEEPFAELEAGRGEAGEAGEAGDG